MAELNRQDREKSERPIPDDQDQALLDRIRDEKNMDAFGELMIKYQDKVWRLARGITRSDSDAEDILQDVFLTVFRKLESFEGRSTFSSWLYRIAANASYMKLRSRKGMQSYAPEDIAPLIDGSDMEAGSEWATGPEETLGSKESLAVVNGAIERLPDEYRVIVVLRDMQGFSNNEVADMLGLSIPAVKSRLHRGRLFLRKQLVNFFQVSFKGKEAR